MGLDIQNNIFAEGDHIRIFAQDDNSVKVMLENHVPFKILGYLHHEDSKPIHTVLMKYEDPKNPKYYMSTNGCTLEVGDKKEVLIELDFYNITLNSKASIIFDVKNILDGIHYTYICAYNLDSFFHTTYLNN